MDIKVRLNCILSKRNYFKYKYGGLKVKEWNQPKCPSLWMNGQAKCGISIKGYYLFIKRNNVIIKPTLWMYLEKRWMKLENIMLRERHQP